MDTPSAPEQMIDSTTRASAPDREAVAEELRQHFLAGRITLEEFEHRLDLALSAVTLGTAEGLVST
jgi:Domain of unknown function (DUF1707)